MRRVIRAWLVLAMFGASHILMGAAGAEPVATVKSVNVIGNTAEVVIVVNSAPAEIATASATVQASSSGLQLPAQVQLDSITQTAVEGAEQRTLILALDASGSMAGNKLTSAKSAAKRFLEVAPPDLLIGIVSFSQRAELLTPPSTDRTAAARAIDGIRAAGNTALFDAIKLSLKTAGDSTNNTVIVLSDGDDTASKVSFQNCLQTIANSSATTQFIAYQRSPGTNAQLTNLANAGTGRIYTADTEDALLSAFSQSVGTVVGTYSVIVSLPSTWDTARHAVAIALGIGETTLGITAQVPYTSTTPAGSRLLPFFLLINVVMILIGIYVFVLLVTESNDRAKRRRIERIITTYAKHVKVESTITSELTLMESLEDLVRPILARRGKIEPMALMLEGAKIERSPEQWVLLRIGTALAGGSIFIILFQSAVFGALVGGTLGWAVPQIFANRRRLGRCKRFEDNLPDSLMLMASSLRAGFSLDQAIVAAADQAGSEMADELRRAIQEIRIGLQLEVALMRIAGRVASEDFAWVVTALRIQRKSGGNLAELLTTAARTVRERNQLHREVQALTAEGRLSAYVLIGLPIGLFAFLGLTQPDYIEPLWSTSLGVTISIVGIVMLAIGWLTMSRMVKVKV